MVAFFSIGLAVSMYGEGFSWTVNDLSDLGAASVENSEIFNWGMMLTGVLGMFFGFGLINYFKNMISRIGSGVLIVGMVFLILVGVYPIETSLHSTVAVLFFGVTALGIFLIGIGESLERNASGFITVFVVLVLIPVVWWSSINYLGLAIPETIGVVGMSTIILIHSLKLITTDTE